MNRFFALLLACVSISASACFSEEELKWGSVERGRFEKTLAQSNCILGMFVLVKTDPHYPEMVELLNGKGAAIHKATIIRQDSLTSLLRLKLSGQREEWTTNIPTKVASELEKSINENGAGVLAYYESRTKKGVYKLELVTESQRFTLNLDF